MTATAPAKTPLISRNLLVFMFAMILANIGGSMYGPLLALYLRDLGANVMQIGWFFTLSQVIPLALQILGGWISDSIGRLRAIALGSLAGIFVYIPLILATSWEWVLLATAISAVTRSLIGPSFDAYIAEEAAPQNRARVFGITQALFQIVSVVGPLLGGWLAQDYGFKPMLVVAALLYIGATLMWVAMARNAKMPEGSGEKLTLGGLKASLAAMLALIASGGVITWILITDGVRDISFALSFNLMPVYMQDIAKLSIQQISITSSVFGAFTMLTFIPGGWLADKKGERVGIISGFALIFVSLMMFINTNDFWLYCLSWAIAGSGVGLMGPAYQSLIAKAVPQHLRGTAFGLFSTSLGVVSLPAPAIGAQLWERISPQFPFAITAWVTLLSVIPVWLKFRLPEAKSEAEEKHD